MTKVVGRLVIELIPAEGKTNSLCCALPASNCLSHKQGEKDTIATEDKIAQIPRNEQWPESSATDAVVYSHERVTRKDINVINLFRFVTYLPDSDFFLLTLFTFCHHPCGWAVEG